MSINDRLQLLIDKVASNKTSFAAATGISTVILSHISTGRNKVSLTAVEQIITAYPNVNVEWLILGKGSMFKEDKDTSQLDLVIVSIKKLQEELLYNYESVDSKINAINQLVESIEL